MTIPYELKPDAYYPIRSDWYGALERYLNNGIMPGGFMTAVLQNNLVEAYARADSDNSENMKNIVGYIYNNLPRNSWGSKEAVGKWLEQFYEANEATA